MVLLSIIIPAKNEFPQVIWTVYSIIAGVPHGIDYEIILVNDASTDKTSTFWGDPPHGCRGLLQRGKMKIINISSELKTVGGTTGLGCWRARNKGFEIATGDFTIFADAHIAVVGDTIQRMVNLLQNNDVQLLHVPVATLGDDPDPVFAYHGYAYKLALQRSFWGAYTNRKLRDEPYTIAMGGFAFCGGKTKFLRELGLWHDGFRGSYCGGEQYIDLKTWLLGGKVWIDPKSLILHSSIPRGYYFTNECMWHNTLTAAYCVGGPTWLDKIFKSMDCERYGDKAANKNLIRQLGKADRQDILRRKKYKSLDEMLKVNPWQFPIKGSLFTNTDNESLPDLVK